MKMLFKSCLDCTQLLVYILHVATGVQCCTTRAREPNFAQLNQIQMSLDDTVDPCQDFYAHACNNWAEQHTNTNYGEITGLIDSKVNQQLINILESVHQQYHPTTYKCRSFVRKASHYYKSCICEKTRNITRYLESVKPANSLEWPLLEELHATLQHDDSFELPIWPEDKWDFFALLGHLQSYGLNNVLISQEIARTKNGSLQIMLEMPHDNASDRMPPDVLMFLLMRLGLSGKKVETYTRKILSTQKRWHEFYRNYSQSSADPENHIKLTYTELGQHYPKLLAFLGNLLPQEIQPDDFVVIANLDYFQYLFNKTWKPREPQNLTNYIMMKFLTHLAQDATNNFTHLDCIKDLRNKMDLALNYLYYKEIYSKKSVSVNYDIVELIQNIRDFYLVTLQENNLNLNEEELTQLQEKLKTLRINVGNLPKPLEICSIEEFYRDVPQLDQRNYYFNHLELLKHRFHKTLLYPQAQNFYVAADNRVGSSSAPIYIPKQHLAILPMGFLQSPIYEYAYHPLFIWSLLGFLLAHEFTHAIDTMGLYFGNDGHMRQMDPTIFENTNFTAALDCMQAQEETEAIDERLADLVGARVAYKAYLKTDHRCGLQPCCTNIPWKKLFFYNMAQFFCGRHDVKFVDHDSDAVRLREIVKNMDGFAEAFKCPAGSPMNPSVKCRLY